MGFLSSKYLFERIYTYLNKKCTFAFLFIYCSLPTLFVLCSYVSLHTFLGIYDCYIQTLWYLLIYILSWSSFLEELLKTPRHKHQFLSSVSIIFFDIIEQAPPWQYKKDVTEHMNVCLYYLYRNIKAWIVQQISNCL